MPDKWKNNLLRFWRGWGISIVTAFMIATSFKSAVADLNDIPTGSMKPTILEGDRLFINKLAYDLKIPYTTVHLARWADPKRGDIVVFYSPQDGKRLIKRVIGLPGDEVAMYKNQLFINGNAIEYKAINPDITDENIFKQRSRNLLLIENLDEAWHAVMLTPSRPSMHSFGPITTPEGKYFMMGDNRDNSADSRFFGFVDRRKIVGRAITVVISRDGSIFHPRWNRFFKTLS